MTNEIKTQKQAQIEDLKAQLTPLYQTQEVRISSINEELSNEIKKILNPAFPIKSEIQVEGIRFWVIVEGYNRSEVNIYNHYIWGEGFQKMYETFNPELNTSGVRIKYSGEKGTEELTKLRLVSLLASELDNFYTKNVGSEFITRMVECFTEVRFAQRDISKIQIEISTIQSELEKAQSSEALDSFNTSFKEGNWYHLKYNPLHIPTNKWNKRGDYEVYFNIKKILKTITIDIYRVSSGTEKSLYLSETKRVQSEDIYNLLRNETLLDESPLKKEIV